MCNFVKYFSLILTLLVISMNGFATTYIGAGNVSGTWKAYGNPYIIQGDISVAANTRLTIEAGVHIQFDWSSPSTAYKLDVYGQIQVNGTSLNHVTIEPINSSLGWRGIRIISPTGNCNFDYCDFTFAKKPVDTNHLTPDPDYDGGALYISGLNNIAVDISHCSFDLCEASFGGVVYAYSTGDDLTISNSEFSNCTAFKGGGVYLFTNADVFSDQNEFHNNSATDGGAMHVISSHPSFDQNSFYENTVTGNGGAIYFLNLTEETEITESLFVENIAEDLGGAMFIYNSPVNLDDIGFVANEAHDGGAIYSCSSSVISINESYFRDNYADHNGGALFLDETEANILWSEFYTNIVANDGGAIFYHQNNEPQEISLNIFKSNDADGKGAALCLIGISDPMSIIGNLIVVNEAYEGGGIYIDGNTADIYINNNTIADNVAISGDGAGVFATSTNYLYFVNDIIWSNVTYDLNSTLSAVVNSSIFDHCDIQDMNLSPTPNQNGTFDDNPDFDNPPFSYRVHASTSPCVEAGDSNVSPITNTDLDGFSRKWNITLNQAGNPFDIGAYENDGNSPSIVPSSTLEEIIVVSNRILIYPNPANEFLFINYLEKIQKERSIIIFDAIGKEVKSFQAFNQSEKIDISELSSGLYCIKIVEGTNNRLLTFYKL